MMHGFTPMPVRLLLLLLTHMQAMLWSLTDICLGTSLNSTSSDQCEDQHAFQETALPTEEDENASDDEETPTTRSKIPTKRMLNRYKPAKSRKRIDQSRMAFMKKYISKTLNWTKQSDHQRKSRRIFRKRCYKKNYSLLSLVLRLFLTWCRSNGPPLFLATVIALHFGLNGTYRRNNFTQMDTVSQSTSKAFSVFKTTRCSNYMNDIWGSLFQLQMSSSPGPGSYQVYIFSCGENMPEEIESMRSCTRRLATFRDYDGPLSAVLLAQEGYFVDDDNIIRCFRCQRKYVYQNTAPGGLQFLCVSSCPCNACNQHTDATNSNNGHGQSDVPLFRVSDSDIDRDDEDSCFARNFPAPALPLGGSAGILDDYREKPQEPPEYMQRGNPLQSMTGDGNTSVHRMPSTPSVSSEDENEFSTCRVAEAGHQWRRTCSYQGQCSVAQGQADSMHRDNPIENTIQVRISPIRTVSSTPSANASQQADFRIFYSGNIGELNACGFAETHRQQDQNCSLNWQSVVTPPRADGRTLEDETQPEDSLDLEAIMEENDGLRRRLLCCVCRQRPRRYMFLPCGHFVCCEICSFIVSICPICRRIIRCILRVYLA